VSSRPGFISRIKLLPDRPRQELGVIRSVEGTAGAEQKGTPPHSCSVGAAISGKLFRLPPPRFPWQHVHRS